MRNFFKKKCRKVLCILGLKNHIDLRKYQIFNRKVNKVDIPDGREEGFLIKQINKEWIDLGYKKLDGKHFSSYILEIEKL